MAFVKLPKQKIICYQGKTLRFSVVLTDSDQNLQDLTGFTARIEVRTALPTLGQNTPDDGDVLSLLTTENGGINIQPELGRVDIFIADEETETFPVGSYFWELELESPSGDVPPIMAPSSFQVLQENTLWRP